jgi:hypothetical protein
LAKGFLLASGAHLGGLVEVVRNYGLSALPFGFQRPSHMQSPPWQALTNLADNVRVSAKWHSSKSYGQGRPVQLGEVLSGRGGLWFDVHINEIDPIPKGFRVQWRITNTGEVAYNKDALRGDFYPPTEGHRRWEELSYHGVHMAEAFIIRRIDDVLVAKSPPFYVVIE